MKREERRPFLKGLEKIYIQKESESKLSMKENYENTTIKRLKSIKT